MVRNGPAAWTQMPRQGATKGEMRMYFTHVAFICNEPSLQPILPQVIFVGASALTKAQFLALEAELPDNVYLKRMPKGWNNADEHKVIIQLLAMILAEHSDLQPIIAFDAAPLHLAPKVLSEIATSGILSVLVPAKCTWLVQPLDRSVFFKFNFYLKQEFAGTFVNGTPNADKMPRMIRLVISAIRYVLQRYRWEFAFMQTGLWGDQSAVSSSIKRDLHSQALPDISCDRPTADMVRRCWPKNRRFDEELVMSLIPGATPTPTVHTASVAPVLPATTSASASSSSSSFPKASAAAPRYRLRTKTALPP